MRKDLMDSLTVDPEFANDINMYENPVGVPQLVKRICDSETDQVSISSMFYVQLLRSWSPKA